MTEFQMIIKIKVNIFQQKKTRKKQQKKETITKSSNFN